MSTASENEKKRQGKSAAAIAAFDAAEQGGAKKAKPKPKVKPKVKPKEKRGTGRDDSQANFNRLTKGLRTQIAAARKTGNNGLAAKLEARIAELRKTIQ